MPAFRRLFRNGSKGLCGGQTAQNGFIFPSEGRLAFGRPAAFEIKSAGVLFIVGKGGEIGGGRIACGGASGSGNAGGAGNQRAADQADRHEKAGVSGDVFHRISPF